jgi:hypothetical protein
VSSPTGQAGFFTLRSSKDFLPGKSQTPSPARIWDLFRTPSAPLGYDPASFWPGCWSDPRFALLGLEPTMIEVTAMAMMSRPRLRWQAGNRS